MRSRRLLALALSATSAVALASTNDVEGWKRGKIIDGEHARSLIQLLLRRSGANDTAEKTPGVWRNSPDGREGSGDGSLKQKPTDQLTLQKYRNATIEGEDGFYFTQEPLIGRLLHSRHLAVNHEINYYVKNRKLYIRDVDGGIHKVEILRTLRKTDLEDAPTDEKEPSPLSVSALKPIPVNCELTLDSLPSGADIEIDGSFVGSTSSTIQIPFGQHQIAIRKKGFAIWSRSVNISQPVLRLHAELDESKN